MTSPGRELKKCMVIKKDYVLFYGEDWASNFALSPITVRDDFWVLTLMTNPESGECPSITFPTAEAYFQSRKATLMGDADSYYAIAHAKTPAEAKKIARKIKLNTKSWDRLRVMYMEDTLRLKFGQNPELMKKLMDPALDGKKFVEASPWDSFWGAGRGIKELCEEIDTFGYIEFFDFESDHPMAINMLGELLNKLRKELK